MNFKLTNKMLASMAVLSLCAGCATDDFRFGGTEEVTFTTAFPGVDVTTRAEASADAAGAQKVMYALVYQGDEFVESKECTLSGNDGTVTLQLASGMEYNIVFWASYNGKTTYAANAEEATASTTPYTINEATGELKVNYDVMAANDDTNDAFTATHHYICGDKNQATTGIQLYRPLAQLNFATDDLDAAVVKKAYGEDPQVYSQIDFQAYTTMNLVGQEITETLSDTKFHTKRGLAQKTILDLGAEKNPKLLHTLYVLAPKAGGTSNMVSDVVLNVYKQLEGGESMNTVSPGSVPLQANYRTNIYGALLTSQTDFTVTIDPSFKKPDNNILFVSSSAQVASAFEAAKAAAATSTDVTGPTLKFESVTDMGGQVVELNNTASDGSELKEITINYDTKGLVPPKFNVTGKVTLNIEDTTIKASAAPRRSKTRSVNSNSTLFNANANATINILSGIYTTPQGVPCMIVDGGYASLQGGSLNQSEMAITDGTTASSSVAAVVKVINSGNFVQTGGTIQAPGGGYGVEAINATAALKGGDINVSTSYSNQGAAVVARSNANVSISGNTTVYYNQFWAICDASSIVYEGGTHSIYAWSSYNPAFSVSNSGSILLKRGSYNRDPASSSMSPYVDSEALAKNTGSHWELVGPIGVYEGTVSSVADLKFYLTYAASGSVLTLSKNINYPINNNSKLSISGGKSITLEVPEGMCLDFVEDYYQAYMGAPVTLCLPLQKVTVPEVDYNIPDNVNAPLFVNSGCTLTLKGAGTVRGFAHMIYNGGNLVIDGVTIDSKTKHNVPVIYSIGSFDFKSGTINAGQTAVKLEGGDMTITNGHIKSNSPASGVYAGPAVFVRNTSKLIMNGGSIVSPYAAVKFDTNAIGMCQFRGGYIYSGDASQNFVNADASKVSFTGGKYNTQTNVTPAAGCSWSAINEVVDGKTYTSQIVGGGAAAPRRRR